MTKKEDINQDKDISSTPSSSKLVTEYRKFLEWESQVFAELSGDVEKEVAKHEKDHAEELKEAERLNELKEFSGYEPTEPERT